MQTTSEPEVKCEVAIGQRNSHCCPCLCTCIWIIFRTTWWFLRKPGLPSYTCGLFSIISTNSTVVDQPVWFHTYLLRQLPTVQWLAIPTMCSFSTIYEVNNYKPFVQFSKSTILYSLIPLHVGASGQPFGKDRSGKEKGKRISKLEGKKLYTHCTRNYWAAEGSEGAY